jgi:hypothetical protein
MEDLDKNLSTLLQERGRSQTPPLFFRPLNLSKQNFSSGFWIVYTQRDSKFGSKEPKKRQKLFI